MDFVVGIIVGAILYYAFCERKKPSGAFVIDLREAAEQPVVIKLHESLDSMYIKKQIILNVELLQDNSLK